MKIDRRNFLLSSSAALLAQNQLLAAAKSKPDQPEEPSRELFPTAPKQVTVYTTADKTKLRISPTDSLSFKAVGQPKETQICVFVDPARQFQTFLGIGGALTDASAETFALLPKEKQREFLDAHFDEERGIGYKLARTNIHSCDFSSDIYTYVDEGDKDLKSFSIDHDKKYRIPFIKQALATARGKLNIFASPWSPPAFMKARRVMVMVVYLHCMSSGPSMLRPYQAYCR